MTFGARVMLGTVALTGVCLGVLVPAAAALAAVTVTLVAPLSGAMVTAGATYELGMRLAVDAINNKGGLLGQQLKAVVVDDGCDPDIAVVAAERALADHPKVIIGHTCSAASIRAAPLYARAGILQISPNSTNPQLTEMGITTVFRMIGRDDRQGMAAARMIADRWPGRLVAVLDDGSVYGRGLADVVRHGLQARGVPIAMNGGYTPDADNYDDIIRSLKDRHIDVLYVGGYAMDVGLLVREMAAARLSIPVLSGDAAGEHGFADVAGPASERLIFTGPPDPMGMPAAAPVIAAAAARHERVERGMLLTYAAVEAWAAAVTRAQSFDAGPVAAALRGPPVTTVVGAVGFDTKGDITGPAGEWLWYRWHNGKVERDAR